MERVKVDEKNPSKAIEHILSNALGNIVILPAAPTAQNHMKANTLGYYNGELFIRLANGEIKKITLTSVV